MRTDYETLQVDLADHVAAIRMNRSKSMNALEHRLRVDLVDCFQELSEDDDIRVVILTGTGKAFSAGGDLRELGQKMTVDKARKYVSHVSRIVLAIQNLEKPVIAAVNGAAMGAGFSIMMACDLVVVSEQAKFSLSFVNVGLLPDLGATYFLPRLLGVQKAKELVFTGKVLSAHELADLGLINDLVPHEGLEKSAFDLARQLAEGPPLALGSAKKLMNRSWQFSLEEMVELEAQSQAACMQSEDHMEGIAAFYEKRKPQFKGR
jgi:2-(1,2-epoxy-1,2-dihydrophenyl)acetyl-CoA isomerase